MTLAETPPKPVKDLKCWRCGKLLAELATKPFRFTCPRCKEINDDNKHG